MATLDLVLDPVHPRSRAMRGLARSAGVLTVLLLSAACTQVYTTPQPTPASGNESAGARPAGGGSAAGSASDDDADESRFEEWDEVLEDARAIPGYFTTHIEPDNTLYLEVPADRVDEEFGLVMHFSKGVGVFNAHDGLPLSSTQLMRFERRGDHLYLVQVNPRFTADEGSPMAASLADNVGNSVVHAFEIESENDSTGAFLIDATSFLVSDYSDVGRQLQPYYGTGNRVAFERGRSHVDHVAAFPENVEIDVFLTFAASRPPRAGSAGVSDWRSIPIGVRYSLFALPEDPMPRRMADDRVGYFASAQRDFSRDRVPDPYTRFIQRWRLEKQDPEAELSEPVEPIVYYIDRTVPNEYRPYVRLGIENWNKAFEAAGFRNAIVARDAPTVEEDSTWSAEDIRYSTVRWSASHQMGYAIGPSQIDPRTGEILNADILISSGFLSGYTTQWRDLAGPDGMLAMWDRTAEVQQTLPTELQSRMCVFSLGRTHQIGLQRLTMAAFDELAADVEAPESFWGPQLVDLIMHEVGHTLGLRHNMKGSSAIPFDRLDDEEYTRENGVTLSVMEYGAVNINPDRDEQGHYVNREVGAYDEWVIRYGYAPAAGEDEAAMLREIARESADRLRTYGTDEDLGGGGWGIDPGTNTWDLSDDPVRWAQQRTRLVGAIQPVLEERVVGEDERYVELREAMNGLVFTRFQAVQPLTKVVGGVRFHRDHRGQPGQRPAFEPVPADEQRAAVRLMVDELLAEDAWSFEAELVNKLAPNRHSDFANSPFGAFPIDWPIHTQVASIQRRLLAALMNNARMHRVVDNAVRTAGAESYGLDELFQTVTDETWSELFATPTRAPDSFRRNLQRIVLDRYEQVLLDREASALRPTAPEDARSLARHHLGRIAERIDTVLDGGRVTDTMHRAHLEESRARIDRALDASLGYPIEG